jgi:nitric oxide dioxygenase
MQTTSSNITPTQVKLVQRSFRQIAGHHEHFSNLFYDKLFSLYPALRGMFHHDMARQRRKVMQMMALIVASLDQPERLYSIISALGERHRGYGVKDSYYSLVSAALLWSLEMCLGARFTPQVKAAWQTLCDMIIEVATTDS